MDRRQEGFCFLPLPLQSCLSKKYDGPQKKIWQSWGLEKVKGLPTFKNVKGSSVKATYLKLLNIVTAENSGYDNVQDVGFDR